MDSMRLESLKNKGEHAQSAIASQEVREHLAGFIRSKRGSSTQINTITSNTKQKNHSQAIAETNGNNINRSQDDGRDQEAQHGGGGGHHFNQHHKNDDHPLRKTASMPTMHIPYKAQSLSRRRQMERRTTMSPLMKRKSRPRRPLLHSLDANEYSSNPCIIQGTSGLNQRSLSQSNSPPPPLSLGAQAAQQLSGSNGGELFRIDHTASGMLAHDHHELFESSSNTTSLDSGGGGGGGCCEGDLKESLRQQHMRVQEAIRKTIISRASSRNKMVVTGGSLDSEMSTSRFDPSLLLATQNSSELVGGQAAATTTKLSGSHFLPLSSHARNRDELRQWSLDGADLRASFNAQKAAAAAAAAAANRTLAYGLFHRLKLGTTNSAATLRRSQSPVSSISMGLPSSGSSTSTSGSQTTNSSAATILSSQPATTQQQQQVASAAVTNLAQNQAPFRAKMEIPRLSQQTARMKLYSSSSSSTSSLFSGQDSLEDSSQAIDLSSSSEASRHKKQQQQQQQQQQHLNPAPSLFSRQQLNSNQRQNYKVLQESFGQLQLCPELKPIVPMPAQHFAVAAQLADQLQQQHPLLDQTNSDTKPSFDGASQRDLSLDGAGCGDSLQGEFIASLAHQFNLSTSAQNLISSQECQQQQHLNSILVQHHHQQHEFNQWLAAHNNLVQSSEFQPANEITSSLLAKILSLPEPYKSTLFAQMLQQQQLHQQQQQQQQDSMHLLDMNQPPPNQTVAAATTTTTTTFINQTQPTFQSQDQNQDRKSIIARALSSPMLVASGTGKGTSTTLAAFDGNNSEEPMQTVDLVASNQHSDHLFEGGHHFDVQMANDDDDGGGGGGGGGEDHANGARRNLFGQPNLTSLDLSVSSQRGKRSEKSPEPVDEHATTRFGQSANATSLSARSNPTKLATNLQGHESASSTLAPFGSGGGGSGSSSEINCNFLYNPVFDQSSRTGLVYELELCNHKCICQNEINHPENSFRVLAIWRRLHDTGLMAKCARIGARRAALSELQLCHGETYANYFGRTPYERFKLRQLDLSKLPIEGLTQLECGGQGADIDTAWNEEQTPGVARLAVGCAIEAAVRVATGKLLNAFAVIRPPGHHAEHQQAMGFCFFNSVAIVARVLIEKHRLERVLIVDWDVHHGNGIQKMFYNDPKVMYISLHRHDRGNFFPGTGDLKELGAGSGLGYNLNVAWSGEAMGDAEYLAAFRALVMPIARDFNPSQVLVACGFDGAAGHPFNFGGYELSAACFGYMTRQLMQLASGRLVLCLEGGYQLEAICDCAQACLQSLLRNEPAASGQKTAEELQMISQRELEREPNGSAREVLHELSNLAAEHWPSVARWRHLIDVSALEAATSKTM